MNTLLLKSLLYVIVVGRKKTVENCDGCHGPSDVRNRTLIGWCSPCPPGKKF